jgi:ferric-dicitrate binding protein FerR (iron transport regulator)
MGYKVDSELLLRYFRGECTDKEAEAVRRWMEEPGNEDDLQAMMQAHWEQLGPAVETDEVDLDKMLTSIHAQTRPAIPMRPVDQEQEPGEEVTEAGSSRPYRRWFRIAASLLLPVLLMTGYFYARHTGTLVPEAGAMKEKANPAAQQSRISLPDGSEVWLNYASTLHYPESFGGDVREVFLEGEAFFEVVENANKPFIVHTKGVDIKVLGTSFNVKSYLDDETVETTLSTGKVLIEEKTSGTEAVGKEPVVLKPSQKASFSKTTGQITLDEVDVRLHTAWKEEILVFRNEPYENVMKQLERRFGVKVYLPDQGEGDCGFTAKFQNEPLEDILEVIRRTTQIHYSLAENTVRIEGQFCE